ncbi:hypothetical protein LCGC14_3137520, partial [marine sediment metagenome]
WGETWTPADINGSTFGFVISYTFGSGDNVITEYLKSTAYGFSIPTGAKIIGIVAKVEAKKAVEASSFIFPNVDHVTLTIHYTSTVQINIGDEFKSMDSIKINIGDVWKDVNSIKINIGDVWKTVF